MITSASSNWSRFAAGARYAVWTTSFASFFVSTTEPMSSPGGYGDRIPPWSSRPAVNTSSSIPTSTDESMFLMTSTPPACP